MIGADESPGAHRVLVLIGVAAAFCAVSYTRNHYWDEYFYVYSVWQHSVSDLVGMERVLSDGLFPKGFFSGKIAFVTLLDALVAVTGPGAEALSTLRWIFCGLTLALGLATWLLLRELMDASAAWKAALVALFLPVPVYLGFKVLSEIPALLLATIGGWQLLRGLRDERAAPFTHLAVAGTSFAAAICMRPTSLLFLVGLVAALLVWRPPPVTPRRLWRHIAVVVAMQAILLPVVVLATIDSPLERFSALASSVTGRRPSPLVAIYALVLTVQFFGVAGLAALRRPLQWQTPGALIWIAAALLPYLLVSRYLEPRYFYTATLPLALVASAGLDRLAAVFTRAWQGLVWAGLLALTVGLNHVVWTPVVLYEIREDQYSRLVGELRSAQPSATYVTPWLSDFCYLAFSFPTERVALALSDSYGSNRLFSQPEFRRWVGAGRYVGDVQELEALPRPRLYVGWDYSPTVRAIDERLRVFGVDYLEDPTRRDGLLNHLTPSWIWSSEALRLKPTVAVGQYRAFEILPREVP